MSSLELELIDEAHGWNWEIKLITEVEPAVGHMVEGLCRLLELGSRLKVPGR